jgi:ABC-2 type transport system ATP-binding protein
VIAGELSELRASVPQRFVDVHFRGPAPRWSTIASVEVLASADGYSRLRITGDGDLAAVVAAARQSDELLSFAYQPPSLSELFREAVAA